MMAQSIEEEIMKLTGKKALITGGNSGIGLATARLFVAEGAEVAITGRDQKTLDEAVTELGANARGYRADVTVAEDRKSSSQHLPRISANLTSSSPMQASLAARRLAVPTRLSLRRYSYQPQRRILYRQFSRSSR